MLGCSGPAQQNACYACPWALSAALNSLRFFFFLFPFHFANGVIACFPGLMRRTNEIQTIKYHIILHEKCLITTLLLYANKTLARYSGESSFLVMMEEGKPGTQ